jgi:ribonuclease G
LKKLVEKLKPKNFSIIIRTVSEGKGYDEINADLNELIEKWKTFVKQIKETPPGAKIYGENDRTTTLLRDILNESFSNIYINNEKLYKETKDYVAKIAPDKEKIVKPYKGKVTLFEHFGIEKQIKGLFGKTVNLPGGAYLIIEHTEALHVIDVNSGNRSLGDKNQEEQALQVNKEAAKEIARQLSLRDMGGIIVIDFIDMQKPSSRKELYRTLTEVMEKDRAKHNILPPSKFGLVQITRQRVRPEMSVSHTETCPTCNGTVEVRPTILIEDDIEKNIAYLFNEQGEKNISISLHPYLAAYFTKGGFFSKRFKWLLKYKKWVNIIDDSSNQLTEYHFLTGKEQENIAI